VALPTETAAGRLGLVAAVCCGWQSARIAYYPLWRAVSDGRPVATRRGALGELEIEPPRAGAPIDLVYARGTAETGGTVLSGVAMIALVAVWLGARARAFAAGASRQSACG